MKPIEFFKLGLLWLFCCLPFAQFAQRSSLVIEVTDSLSQEPLYGATIVLSKHKHPHITDARGRAKIDSLPAGLLLIHTSYVGYHHHDTLIQAPFKGVLKIDLCPEHYHLHELLVGSTQTEDLGFNKRNLLSHQSIQQRSQQNLAALLEQVNGVTLISSAGNIAKPVIRGLSGMRLVTLQGNTRIEGQQWGDDHGPEVDPFSVYEAEVIKGAASLEYGPEAIGGAIRLLPKPWRTEAGWGAGLQLQTFSNNLQGATSLSAEARHNTQSGWFGARATGSGRKAGDSRAPNYVISNTAFEEWAANTAIAWQVNKLFAEINLSTYHTTQGIFAGSHLGNIDDLKRALQSPEPLIQQPFTYQINRPKQVVGHTVFNGLVRYEPNKKTALSVSYAQQVNRRQEYDADFIYNQALRGLPAMDLEIQTLSADVKLSRQLAHHWKLNSGIAWNAQYNTTNSLQFIIPEFRAQTYGMYATLKKELVNGSLVGGLRYDYRFLHVPEYRRFSQTFAYDRQFDGLSAAISYHRQIRQTLALQLNAGTGFRPPAVNELYSYGLHYGLAAFEIGNDSLNAERAWYTEATLGYNKQAWRAELSVYCQYMQGFIYRNPLQNPMLTIRGAFPAFAFTQNNARLAGAEASVQYVPELAWFGGVLASVLFAQNLDLNQPLIFMPANRASAWLGYQWQKQGAIKDPSLRMELLGVAKQNRYVPGLDYADPPRGYMLLNARAGMAFKPSSKAKPWQLYASVQNLLNNSYRDYLSRFRYFTDEPGINFILTLQITIH